MRNPFRRQAVQPPIYDMHAYCCICVGPPDDKFQSFVVQMPRGTPPDGVRATCPRCGCTGWLNSMGQLWPRRHL